jgi:hypothetical protein
MHFNGPVSLADNRRDCLLMLKTWEDYTFVDIFMINILHNQNVKNTASLAVTGDVNLLHLFLVSSIHDLTHYSCHARSSRYNCIQSNILDKSLLLAILLSPYIWVLHC